MDIKLINIGFGNVVSANRIVAIVSPESAPIKQFQPLNDVPKPCRIQIYSCIHPLFAQ
jgi:hypothetical protein